MTTTASEPEVLKDGQFLPMQSREFEILELTVRGKSKDKGKDKGTGKKPKGKGKDGARRVVDGVEVLEDPGNPGAEGVAAETEKADDNSGDAERKPPPPAAGSETDSHDEDGENSMAVSYTHLTLPTICSV